MEGSSTHEEKGEVVDHERTTTFSLYHPCYFFEEALRALFKCLGLEFGTKEKKISMDKAASESEENDPITPENTESNSHRSSQEYSSTSTTQNWQLVTSIMVVKRGPRRPELSRGSGPQTN
ncbi:hypothetical protein TanjilG_25701 [Lupinus angustifolius]|uniref:Uncharacterized protein n=1 Tax=Lupinus angustifolius TaxID=3871 RepID=A0A1J7HI47_LUPAN|nr:PREDICTED: uncharacterized protein LOC109360019 [Lupinus angustifolius]XP_019460301.1 PREDICTED: uncharacterized protein LOC109360019 [Lupinus angustifolius]OIW01405.1 hypothetical protein TanjilG_25701 [Lupinus angustifolius]